MNNRILVSIDVTKINKSKMVNGQKGVYLDLILIPTPDSKYGDDFLVKQEIKRDGSSPEDRGLVIGNARELKPDNKPIPF